VIYLDNVKVNRTELLDKLRANREKHETDYTEAVTGYRAERTEELHKLLTKLQDSWNLSMTDPTSEEVQLSFHVSLNAPRQYLEDYDESIMMMEMSTDDIIELTKQDFATLVMDRWKWKLDFTTSNVRYASKGK
jgi:uncharacterized protein YecA (UPF0149 family)